MKSYTEITAVILDELRQSLGSVSSQALDELRALILRADRVFVAGKGRSGLHMRAFAMRLMHLGLTAYVVDDVTTPAIGAGDLLLIGSGSGRTPSLVQYAAKARDLGAKVALISTAVASPVAEKADCVVHIAAPTQKAGDSSIGASAQPMANLFEQSLGLLLDSVTQQLMDELDMTSDVMFTRHANLE